MKINRPALKHHPVSRRSLGDDGSILIGHVDPILDGGEDFVCESDRRLPWRGTASVRFILDKCKDMKFLYICQDLIRQ